jgi:hypothetical protein
MKKIEETNSILKTVSEELTIWFNEEGSIRSGSEYEQRILEMGQRITKAILIESIGKIPKSRNQKKTPHLFRAP